MPETEAAAARALLLEAAEASGEIAKRHFGRAPEVWEKPGLGPVTAADIEIDRMLRAELLAARPGYGWLSEETPDSAVRLGAERVFIVDPIDGTRAFIAGRPLFGTLIALMEAGRPILGVIDQPIARERWLGTSAGTTLNGAAVRTRSCAGLTDAHLATTAPQLFDPAGAAFFQRLRTAARDTIYGGDCHNYGLVACGCLDLVVESELQLYDWAALVPVVEGAGGRMCDWSGADLRLGSDGRVVAAGDPALVAPVLARL